MRKLIISLVLSTVSLVPLFGWAQQLTDGAPSSYTVVHGDTLWGISGKYLKDPWRWPEIWNMNRDQVKNPHLIYPGDVIRLEFTADGKPRLSIDGEASIGGTVKLSPTTRVERLSQAIPSIPGTAIGPFLSQPLIVDEKGLDDAPRIVATEEGRVVVGAGNIAYVDSINPAAGTKWQIYRPAKPLRDPDTLEILGYEASYLGDARATRFGQPSTIEITRSNQEIGRGDRLTPNHESAVPSFSPRAPEKNIQGKIISVDRGVAETAQFAIVALNRGKKDGLEVGHVLVTYHTGEVVPIENEGGYSTAAPKANSVPVPAKASPVAGTANVNVVSAATVSVAAGGMNFTQLKLPDERSGLVFVFRVFDRVSYALVMNSRGVIHVNDIVQTP
jgi:hypothetical protein